MNTLYMGRLLTARPRARQSFAYIRGVFCLTPAGPRLLSAESRHQLGERQKICDPKERTSLANYDLWVGRDDVGPVPWHRAHTILVDA